MLDQTGEWLICLPCKYFKKEEEEKNKTETLV